MSQRIIITVAPSGMAQVRTEGFSGSSCQKASEFIERAIGQRESEQLTQDYYKASTEAGCNTLTQGEAQ